MGNLDVKLLNQKVVDGFISILEPIISLLKALNVHPNVVTAVGLFLSIISGWEFYLGNFVTAGILLVLAGICDVLDGRLARSSGRVSRTGAFFDSVIDRYSEIFIFMGLAAHFDSSIIDALLLLTLGGSLLTSYVRARAEGLGIECKIGIMQRPERLTYLSAGAIFSFLWDGLLIIAIIIVAIFSNITAIQRISHAFRKGNRSV